MAGPGTVDFRNLWKRQVEAIPIPKGMTREQLEPERQLNLRMLSLQERRALVKISPDCAYVMGVPSDVTKP